MIAPTDFRSRCQLLGHAIGDRVPEALFSPSFSSSSFAMSFLQDSNGMPVGWLVEPAQRYQNHPELRSCAAWRARPSMLSLITPWRNSLAHLLAVELLAEREGALVTRASALPLAGLPSCRPAAVASFRFRWSCVGVDTHVSLSFGTRPAGRRGRRDAQRIPRSIVDQRQPTPSVRSASLLLASVLQRWCHLSSVLKRLLNVDTTALGGGAA